MTAFVDDMLALTDAAANHDRLAAWDAAGRLVSHFSGQESPASPDAVRRLVWSGAADCRWFDIAELLAGAAAGRHDASPSTRRLHAQMLMERGFTEEAHSRLSVVLKDPGLPSYDRGQAYGHIGRIHKDRFVGAAVRGDEQSAREALRIAIEAYLAGRNAEPTLANWLGINAAALLAREEALAIRADAKDAARALAREIRSSLSGGASIDPYRAAIEVEAALVLGEHAASLNFAQEYVASLAVNGFALNNFHRQLSQVWRLEQCPSPGPEIMMVVGAAVMEKSGGALRLSSAVVKQAHAMTYQAVFDKHRFDSIENYRRGLERCASVVRIGSSTETGDGTGFVIAGHLLSPAFGERLVVVTNSHVVSESDSERGRGALHPAEAVVTFAAMPGIAPDKTFGLKSPLLFASPREELDVVVAELTEPIAVTSTYPIAPILPVATSAAPVRVVGHPSGRGLSLSVNQLLDHEAPRLHYRTATEGGSSGSPVFSHDWNLIGLHHAGGDAVPRLNGQAGTYQANEGIWIKSIIEAVGRAQSATGK